MTSFQHSIRPRLRVWPWLALALLSLGACRNRTSEPSEALDPNADRLAPGEQLPDTQTTFGLEVPPGMRVTARFDDVVQLQGNINLDQLTRYYQKRLAVAAIEMTENQAEFRRAYVKGDERKRLYRVVITQKPRHSLVRISDVTPAPKVEGLSEAERWERAGLQPNGSLKDRLNVY